MNSFFAYTQVRNAAQNLGFNCAISFCLNIYYGISLSRLLLSSFTNPFTYLTVSTTYFDTERTIH